MANKEITCLGIKKIIANSMAEFTAVSSIGSKIHPEIKYKVAEIIERF